MAKVSIIVPIYNAESYLERCICSLCNQTEQDIEIILIDDGSKDNSYNLCIKFQSMDKRVKVFQKQNGGPHSSRKMGIHKASGALVAFVDADDWMEPDAIERMLLGQCESQADVVICGYTYDEEHKSTHCENDILDGKYDGDDLVRDVYEKMLCDNHTFSQNLTPSLWGKLFYRDRLQKVMDELDDDIAMGEDLACTMGYILNSKVVLIDNKNYAYHYCANNDSLTYRYDEHYFDKTIRLYKFLDELLDETDNKRLKDNFNRYKIYLIYRLFGIMLKAERRQELQQTLELLKEACNKDAIIRALHSCNISKLRISSMSKCALYNMKNKNVLALRLLSYVWWFLITLKGRIDRQK